MIATARNAIFFPQDSLGPLDFTRQSLNQSTGEFNRTVATLFHSKPPRIVSVVEQTRLLPEHRVGVNAQFLGVENHDLFPLIAEAINVLDEIILVDVFTLWSCAGLRDRRRKWKASDLPAVTIEQNRRIESAAVNANEVLIRIAGPIVHSHDAGHPDITFCFPQALTGHREHAHTG